MTTDLELARLCAATYSEPCHSIRHDRGVVNYQVHAAEGETILAIQGTQDRAQALADANAWPKRSRAGWWAHAGFLTAAEALEPFVRHNLPGKIKLIGHSLGGAIAQPLAGLLLESRDPSEIEVVCFGAPRVGMFGLRRVLKPVKIRLYRVRIGPPYANDIVPTVPWPFPVPYRHARGRIRVVAP